MSDPTASPAPPVAAGVALVTGGARRIGRAIVTALSQAGWRVAVHCHHSRHEAEALIAQLPSAAAVVCADLACEDQTTTLIEQASNALGPISCLINNASTFENDSLATATRASWDLHMEVNLRAPLVLTQEFARQLPPQTPGNVINIIDQRVWNLRGDFTTYTLSKAGLWTLTQTAALALAPRIRVNGIGPGPTLPSSRQSAAQFAAQCRAQPLQRAVTPEEIAAAVSFILATPSLTGQMLALDAGQHLGATSPGGAPEE